MSRKVPPARYQKLGKWATALRDALSRPIGESRVVPICSRPTSRVPKRVPGYGGSVCSIKEKGGGPRARGGTLAGHRPQTGQKVGRRGARKSLRGIVRIRNFVPCGIRRPHVPSPLVSSLYCPLRSLSRLPLRVSRRALGLLPLFDWLAGGIRMQPVNGRPSKIRQ